MFEPVVYVGGQAFGAQDRVAGVWGFEVLGGEGGPGAFEGGGGFVQVEAAGIFLEHLETPAEGARQLEGAALVEPAAVEVVGGLGGGDALKSFGLLGGGEPLGDALVGEAVHAEAAVGFGALAEGGDGLGSVAGFVAKGVEGSFGAAASAHVLNDDVEAVAGKEDGVRVDDAGGNVAAVGLAHEEGRVGFDLA